MGGWVRVGRDWPLTRNLAKRAPPLPLSQRESKSLRYNRFYIPHFPPAWILYRLLWIFGQPCTHLKQQHGPHQFLFSPPVKVGNFSKANNCSKVPRQPKNHSRKKSFLLFQKQSSSLTSMCLPSCHSWPS